MDKKEPSDTPLSAEEKRKELLNAIYTFCVDRDGELSDEQCALGYILAFEQSVFERTRERAAKEAKRTGDEFMRRADRCCGNELDELKEVNKALGCKESSERIRALRLEDL